jgi:hypothetical protein
VIAIKIQNDGHHRWNREYNPAANMGSTDTMNSNAELFSLLDKLVDGWCERRALVPLRTILPAYPMMSPLSDGWFELRNALRNLRCLRQPVVTDQEATDVEEALRTVELALDRQ